MHITFSPVRGDTPLVIDRQGDTLTLNGDLLDLSVVPDGATLPAEAVASPFLAGPITRKDGILHLTLALAHGAQAPEETRFPEPITLTEDGPVDLPAYEVIS